MTAPTTGEREPDEISAALNDLEHAVKCEYAFPNVHPAMQRKFDRDMSVVTDARNAYDALRADLARVTAERDEVVEACRGTQMDNAAIASMWSYVREKIGIQAERDALRSEVERLRFIECAAQKYVWQREAQEFYMGDEDDKTSMPEMLSRTERAWDDLVQSVLAPDEA